MAVAWKLCCCHGILDFLTLDANGTNESAHHDPAVHVQTDSGDV
jgi:hypothetical protein